LKALLQEAGHTIPRTHILRDILSLLIPSRSALRSLARGLRFLTRFAVGTRYPGESANKRDAEAALRWAGRVRRVVRPLLGLRIGGSRRGKA
jgi:HEPN domain-containing protein